MSSDSFGQYHEAILTFGRRLERAAGSPQAAAEELDRLLMVCPVLAESAGEVIDDIHLFLDAEGGRVDLPRPEAYDAFPSFDDAVSHASMLLLREYPDPEDAIHEMDQVAIIFPTLSECLAELLDGMREHVDGAER